MKKNVMVALLALQIVNVGLASADGLKPIKVTATEVGGAIFTRPNAVNAEDGNTKTTDVVTYESNDAVFQTGMFKSGPMREVLSGIGMPYDEFLYFTSGGITLTSSDGTMMTVSKGESVTIPKGWTGVFETSGYEKIYTIYDGAAKKKED